MRLAVGAGQDLGLDGEHLQVVGQASPRQYRVESGRQLGVLGGDAGRIGAGLEVLPVAGRGAQLAVLAFVGRVVVADGDQRSSADRRGIGAQRQRLGHVCARSETASGNQLHLTAVDSELAQRPHRLGNGSDRRDADVLDEHVLSGCGAALHAVHHYGVRSGFYRQRGVVVGASRTDLDVDRHLPVGDLAQFADLDLEIVGPGPIRVAAG